MEGLQRLPIRVSLVATPETVASSLYGVYDALWFVGVTWDDMTHAGTAQAQFLPEIVAVDTAPIRAYGDITITPQRAIAEVEQTDIVYFPSVFVALDGSLKGRHPALIEWVGRMYARGATLCSACAGSLMIAEAGLLEGCDATTHWAFTQLYQREYPTVRLHPERILVASGADQRIVTAGGASSWSDLVLYLVQRYVGARAAHQLAKALLLQWHSSGQSAYASMLQSAPHEDALIQACQVWLAQHYARSDVLAALVEHAGLQEKTLQRRFKQATGYAVLQYVQNLRIEEAKQMLEASQMPVEAIAHSVGYDDMVFFRKLFKRFTGVTPAAYRKSFQLPRALVAPTL